MANKVTVVCDSCGVSIEKYPSLVKPRNFCSTACLGKWRATRTGELNPRWKGGSVSVPCVQCGRHFDVIPALATRQKYCSQQCKAAAQRMPRVCKHCGKLYSGKVRTFCTSACFLDYRKAHPQPHSVETRAKLSVMKRGSSGLSGAANPAFRGGQAATIEHVCPICQSIFVAPAHRECCSRPCAIRARQGKLRVFYQTPPGLAILGRYAAQMTGSDDPSWHGPVDPRYTSGFTRTLKTTIYQRDGYMCRRCGAPKVEPYTHVIHHIDGGKTNHDPMNLITLCKGCHIRVHREGIDAALYLP